MEGYHLRSRSVPPDTRAPDSVPPPWPTVAPCPPEGPVDESGPVGHYLGFVAAEQPEAGYPIMDTWLETASAGLSWATTLRAPLPDSPQEVRDISAQGDTAQVPDPEAFANVGASVGQTTQHAPSFMSSLGLGCASGEPTPDFSRFSLPLPGWTQAMGILSLKKPQPTLGTTTPTQLLSDPSQARKVAMPKNTRQSYIAHFAPGTAFWWTQPI